MSRPSRDTLELDGRSSVGKFVIEPGPQPLMKSVGPAAPRLIGLMLALLLISGCSRPAPPPVTPPPPTVRVIELATAKVVDYEYFTGRTDATEMVEVRARVTGYLDKVGFQPGDVVGEKHVLFQIDPRPYQAELNRVNSQVLLSQAKLKLAEADVARTKDIAKTPGAISKQDIDRYLSAKAEADATVKSTQAMVEMAQLNVGFTEVKAPIAGRVGRNLMTVGNLVVQDQTLLTTIVSEDPMYAYFDVDERTMLRIQSMVRDGQISDARKVEIRYGLSSEKNEYPHDATLDFINNRINASTGTLQIRAKISNPKPSNNGQRLLTPGLFIRIRLGIGDARKGLVVPQSAIGSDQSRKYLMVVTDKNIVEYRPITAGPIQPDGRQHVEPISVIREETGFRQVREGETGEDSIKAGENVIVGGMQRVRPGITVQTKPFESATPAKK